MHKRKIIYVVMVAFVKLGGGFHPAFFFSKETLSLF